MKSSQFTHTKMEDQLVDQSPSVPIKAPRVGYRTTHLVLNCICFAMAVHEFYMYYMTNRSRDAYYVDGHSTSVRLAYLVIITGLTVASAVAHGIGSVYRHPNKSQSNKSVLEVVYYSFSFGLHAILSVVLFVRFYMEIESYTYQSPFVLTITVVTFINAMVYLAAAVNAFITLNN